MTRPITRRTALAGLGLAAASAGCLGRTQNLAGRDRSDQLTLEINVTPADGDPNGIRIARQLEEHLGEVGIDARLNTLGPIDLLRKVLINQNFDIYVGQFVETEPFDPDALYGLSHSRFVSEPGWQNPFGLTEITVDDLVEGQRRETDAARTETVETLQETLVELQPFNVVAFPDALTAVQERRFEGWTGRQPLSVGGILGIDRVDSAESGTDDADGSESNESSGDDTSESDADSDEAVLRLVTTDVHITENWNPLAVEYRRHGTFMGLLYDPLVRVDGPEVIPWLAADWERVSEDSLDVTLRDARWHDGDPVTASDVAFTYEFLRDTSMGDVETPVPTPRFRGRSSVVNDVRVIDDHTARLAVADVNEEVAVRALQVPILPEHVWSERTDTATIAGIGFDVETTEAIVSNNEDPVGSGPLRFADSTAEESLTLERNPDHFLVRAAEEDADDPRSGIPSRYHEKPAFERLEVEVMPSDISAVEAVVDEYADATVSNLGPESVPRIDRSSDTRLVSGRSAAFYHVGYNVRKDPLSNPRFRRILARLIDKSRIVEEVFDGYAQPGTSPLAASQSAVPDSLMWDDRDVDPVYPFAGEDGTLDAEAVRAELREAGYRFDENDRLLSRGR